MSVGYSGTPLAAKLGIKSGCAVYVRDAPPLYKQLLAPLPLDVRFVRSPERATVLHVFATEREELASHLKQLRDRMPADAALWISWPKKASKVATTITEDTVRELALPLGLVDIKVCAVDAIWSGLKLVIRKELRPVQTRQRT